MSEFERQILRDAANQAREFERLMKEAGDNYPRFILVPKNCTVIEDLTIDQVKVDE